jgi:hypothetical protein
VKSFPQIDFSTFVSDEEIARFANSPPGIFPNPQYVNGVQQTFNYKNNGMYKKVKEIKIEKFCFLFYYLPFTLPFFLFL